MTSQDEFDISDPQPTARDLAIIASISPEVLGQLDRELINAASGDWRKMARIVGTAMTALEPLLPELSDSYYSYRLREFVAAGLLEARGSVEIMRFCELRLPTIARQTPAGAHER